MPPERPPDHEVTYQTSPDQAFVYRLNGDRNPLHTDPSFAAAGGFDRPILHGLCSYGFTGRALLHALCGSDPARFHHIEARFASPVMPGEALTVRAWETGDGEAVFTTSVGDRVVIDQGLAPLHLNPVPILAERRSVAAKTRTVRRRRTDDSTATTSASATSRRSPVRRSLTSIRPSATPRPTTTIVGMPSSSASLNLTPGRHRVAVVEQHAQPGRLEVGGEALGDRPLLAAGLAGDDDVDVGRGDLARPAQPELVARRLGDRRHGP